ncbi:TetR/AcrR family transcriptional regulator [Enemella sp. A6]|uniref:TetR/AcrR family transcriptional regulator n=1 Tax=Enemella sp. A6 TaxID=3440152 RepID=UPI003EBE6E23
MGKYHHGDLRRAVLDRALEVVAESGPRALSLRAIAADLGVSHTAPRHHFGSNAGLLSAIAVEGFRMLRERLVVLREAGAPLLDLGVAYVEFATEYPAHFAVMFEPTLTDPDDPTLAQAADEAFGELRAGVAAMAPHSGTEDAAALVIAAWSLMHGLATLELTGNLARSQIRGLLGLTDFSEIARRAGVLLTGAEEDT